jgi:uncharacterized YccA/Bax inhibitor family protein
MPSNTILAIVIVVITFAVLWGKPSLNMILAALGALGCILAFVAVSAAGAREYGPAMGLGAFVITIGLFYFFRKK